MTNDYTHLDLFSGIGGFSLAAESAGFRTVAFCEREPYPVKVLNERWPGIPIHPDIFALNGTTYRGISLVTGGFPCQPFSIAGRRRGKEDDRHLWPQMCRVVSEAEPDWVLGENVVGLDGLGLESCITDLESIGYEVAPPLIVPACAVGAWHRRDRIWIIANANRGGSPWGLLEKGQEWEQKPELGGGSRKEWAIHQGFDVEPSVARMVHGVPKLPHSTKRLEALGNAIVPRVAEVILSAMMKQIKRYDTTRTSQGLHI